MMDSSPPGDLAADPAPHWEPGAPRPVPATDEIHVWIASMTYDGGDPTDYSALGSEEVERVEIARSEVFRQRFVRSRSILRRILSRYLSVDPAEIPLLLNEHGRPYLADEMRGGMDFNLSHTDDWAVFAFGWGRRVGIDLERLDRKVDWRRIAASTFSELERRQLEEHTAEGGTHAFLRGWLRKEAYSKARGDGFAYGFSDFSVSIAASPDASGLLEDLKDPEALKRWWIRDLDLGPPLASALAAEGECRMIRRWRYTP